MSHPKYLYYYEMKWEDEATCQSSIEVYKTAAAAKQQVNTLMGNDHLDREHMGYPPGIRYREYFIVQKVNDFTIASHEVLVTSPSQLNCMTTKSRRKCRFRY